LTLNLNLKNTKFRTLPKNTKFRTFPIAP